MKKYWIAVLALVIVACENKNQPKETSGSGQVDVTVEKDKSAPESPVEIAEGAQRFLGNYQDREMENVKATIKKDPTHEGFLAIRYYIDGKTEGALPLMYDPNKDYLTSRYATNQPKYSIITLQEDRLVEIYYNLSKDTVDTTVYFRNPKQ